MGMSALRRYHKPLADQGAAVEAAPEVEPGTIDSPQEKIEAAEADAAKVAAEQAEQADRANDDQDGAESVNPVIQAAGGVEDNPAEPEPATIPTTSIPSAAPGDVNVATDADVTGEPEARNLDTETAEERAERAAAAGLTRGSSTKAWQDFAGDTSRSRDELAELYLGPKGS